MRFSVSLAAFQTKRNINTCTVRLSFVCLSLLGTAESLWQLGHTHTVVHVVYNQMVCLDAATGVMVKIGHNMGAGCRVAGPNSTDVPARSD